jgi:HEAT repeat protein
MSRRPRRFIRLVLAILALLWTQGVATAVEPEPKAPTAEEVRSLLVLAGGTGPLADRTTAIRRLGEIGDLDSVVSILTISLRDPQVRRPSWAAVTGILRRHSEPDHYRLVYDLFSRVPPDCRIRLASCVADADSVHGARLLSDLLGPDRDLDSALLSGLLRMNGVTEDPLIMERIRNVLRSEHDHLRRDAAHVLGSLEDQNSIPALIELLGDRNTSVRDGAHWSLRNISGLTLPANVARWRYWYAQETRWWTEQSDAAIADLDSGNPGRIVAAIHALSQRSLHRDDVEELLRSLSDHDSEAVRSAMASALVAIGAEPDRPLGSGMGLGDGTTVAMVNSTSRPVDPTLLEAPPQKTKEPENTTSNWLLHVAGGFLILALLTRVLGVWSIDRARSVRR